MDWGADNALWLAPLNPAAAAMYWIAGTGWSAAMDDNEHQQDEIEEQQEMLTINYNSALSEVDAGWAAIEEDYTQKKTALERKQGDATEEFAQLKQQTEENAVEMRQQATDQFQTAAGVKKSVISNQNDAVSGLQRDNKLNQSSGLSQAGASGTRNTGNTKSSLEQIKAFGDEDVSRAKDDVLEGIQSYKEEAEDYTRAADHAEQLEYQKVERAQTQFNNYNAEVEETLKNMETTKDRLYNEIYGEGGKLDFLTQKYNQGTLMLETDIDWLQENKWTDAFTGMLDNVTTTINIASLFAVV